MKDNVFLMGVGFSAAAFAWQVPNWDVQMTKHPEIGCLASKNIVQMKTSPKTFKTKTMFYDSEF